MRNAGHWAEHHRKLAPRDAAIVKDYQAGSGILDLMKKYDVSGYQTVVNVIRAEEVRTKTSIMRPPGTNVRRWHKHHEALKERDQAIIELYLQGRSIKWLSENFNLAWQTVQRVLKRAEDKTGKKIIRPPGGASSWMSRREEEDNDVAS